VKEGTKEEIWKCDAHLYTMESFLYQTMNEYMKLAGDPSNTDVWSPFSYLLQVLTFSKNTRNVMSIVELIYPMI
jgi:hypothetical protein